MDWYDPNDMWLKAMRSYGTLGELREAYERILNHRATLGKNDLDRALMAERLRYLTELMIGWQDVSDVPTLHQRVARLAEGGLTFAQAQEVFAARQGEDYEDVIARARFVHDETGGEVTIDESPVVSVGADGTWVSAWVFVAAEAEPADDTTPDDQEEEDPDEEEDEDEDEDPDEDEDEEGAS